MIDYHSLVRVCAVKSESCEGMRPRSSTNTLSRTASSRAHVPFASDGDAMPDNFNARHGNWDMSWDHIAPSCASKVFIRGEFARHQHKAKFGIEGSWRNFFVPQSIYYHMRINNMVRRDFPTNLDGYEFFTEVDRW